MSPGGLSTCHRNAAPETGASALSIGTRYEFEAQARHAAALFPAKTGAAHEIPGAGRASSGTAAASVVVAASDVLHPIARIRARGIAPGQGAALQAEEQVELAGQLREDGG
jgi:hypothetical protein